MLKEKKISISNLIPEQAIELLSFFIYIQTLINAISLPKSKIIFQQKEELSTEQKRELEQFAKNIKNGAIVDADFRKRSTQANVRNFVKGWRVIGGKRYFFKSLWEMNYSRYLEYLKKNKEIKDWEYEPETFWFKKIMRGVRSYKPDFRTVDYDDEITYYEVKGYLDGRSATKIKRMRKYYPKVHLIIIDYKWFNTKGKQYSALIKGWEKKAMPTDEFYS